jgi:hypothetical protein
MRLRAHTSRSVPGAPDVSGAVPQTLAEIPPSRIAGCALAAVALVVGVWYVSFGLSLFVNLSLVTHRFIVASGDSDFWLDVDKFRAAGAILAALAFVLGLFTIRASGQTFVSRYEPRRHWLLLMGVAVVVSLLRAVAESFGGVLTPWRVGSFAAVCAIYACLWIIDRPPESNR